MAMLTRCAFLLRAPVVIRTFRLPQALGYKSQYSLDKLYPQSSLSFGDDSIINKTGHEEEFSGFIPIGDVDIKYSRGSGPGGQHVNKVNTKVEVRFHVLTASWLPKHIRSQLMDKEQGRITKDGYLIVTSDKTRKQMLNQADCFEKIRAMVWNAAKKPNEPSTEDIQLMQQRKTKAKKAVLREKKSHSLKKQSRQQPNMDSV